MTSEESMIRKTFEHEIQQVKDEVLLLGTMVEHAIMASVEALKKRDIKGAEKIIADDKEINKKRFDNRKPVDDPDRHAAAHGA